MGIKYNLTKKVSNFISDSELEEIEIGCSDSQVIKITKNSDVFFLKIAKKGMLTSEYNKLTWLNGKLKVPEVVLYDYSLENEYLITASLSGSMLCSKEFEENPELGLKIIVEAFKNIEAVNITDCPFNVNVDYRIAAIRNYISQGLIKFENLKEETRNKYKSLEDIVDYLEKNKFESEPCFSHGDPSLPNIFADNKKFSGFIDVGESGIADKWFDLAICEKSIRRNYGEEYVSKFYEKLNIIPDRKKIDYYLLMLELCL